ncbi:MAG: NAD-dependent epimerase/dehydratase family protein [Isosphaeraceae bacterium]
MTLATTDSPLDLVTGGTGMLGSHIAERLVAQGRRVRALVRPGSDTRFLQTLGAELLVGDLTDPASCARAVEGVEVVYHSAAKVGDWGKWSEFQSSCIDATRVLGEAAASAGVGRFLHISSTSAYGHPAEGSPPIDESAPMGQNLWVWDGYTRSKVESEQALWRIAESSGLQLTVIRPSWLYGERDRTTTARLMHRLRSRKVPLIGRGNNPLSAIYVGIVADAAILAARHPAAVGQAYNITSQGPITQKEFMGLFAAACGAPRIRRKVPYRITFAVALLFEAFGRLTGQTRPPLVTRYATWLMGRNLEYSTEKARQELGWSPSMTYAESIERTVGWFLAQERIAPANAAKTLNDPARPAAVSS